MDPSRCPVAIAHSLPNTGLLQVKLPGVRCSLLARRSEDLCLADQIGLLRGAVGFLHTLLAQCDDRGL